MRTTPDLLVLGLGNDILTDDAVGLLVVEAARAELEELGGIVVRSTTEMGLALLDEIAGHDGVILVDSVQTGKAPPGHIHDLALAELPGILTTSPHFLGVRETIALGGMLGLEMPRQVRIVAIEVADPYTLGTEPTSAVRQSVAPAGRRVVERARGMIRERPQAG